MLVLLLNSSAPHCLVYRKLLLTVVLAVHTQAGMSLRIVFSGALSVSLLHADVSVLC
jgi:hypothetical protein